MFALEGITILDLSGGYPPSFATGMLGDMGADVINIEGRMSPEKPSKPTILCPTCGTRVSEDAARCLVCGTDLTGSEKASRNAKAVQGSHLDTKRIAATFRDFNLWLIKNHLAVTLAQVTSENIAAFHADLVQQDHSFDSAHRAKRILIIFEAWLNQKRQFRSFPKS